MMKNSILSKETLLEATQEGLTLYRIAVKDKLKLKACGTRSVPVLNPLYGDSNPSLNFYLGEKGGWRHHDFGNPHYSGDVFDFYAEYWQLDIVKDFKLLLNKMWKLFNEKDLEPFHVAEKPKKMVDFLKKIELHTKEWTNEELSYWAQYGVGKDILQANNVYIFRGYTEHFVNGRKRKRRYDYNNLSFAYKLSDTCIKVYTPNPKGFLYAGTKPSNYYLGTALDHVEPNTPLFVCAGFKDALCVIASGHEAIALNSESSKMSKRMIKEFYKSGYKTVILFDTDETGKREAERLAKETHSEIANLSSILKQGEEHIKDVADFLKADLTNNRIRLQELLLTFAEDKKLYIDSNQEAFQQKTELLSVATNTLSNEEIDRQLEGLDQYLEENWDIYGIPEPLSFIKNYEEEDKPMKLVAESQSLYSIAPEEKAKTEETEEKKNDSIEVTHRLSLDQGIYNKASEFLQRLVKPHKMSHERDVIFLSAICVLGNIFKVHGIYDRKKMSSNLMGFFTAPASAGKGCMKHSRTLGKCFEDRYKEKYKIELVQYKEDGESGDKPIRERFFIPGNASSSAMINSIDNNDGTGVILEYEADALNNSISNKTWGDFTSVLRNAYENEAINKGRVDDDVDIENPRLSVAISGTKNQLFQFIPSVENGLFSRFFFYEFPLVPIFKDVFESKEDLSIYYTQLSRELLEFYDNHSEIEFEFTEDQGRVRFKNYFEKQHNKFYVLLGDDSLSLIRRLGSMCFRIAMILSVSRYIGSNNVPTKIVCNEVDFELSLSIIDTLINQAESIYLQLPKLNTNYSKLKTVQQELLDSLSDEFTYQDALDKANERDIPSGTLQRHLRKFQQYGLIERYKQGHYRKLS